MAIRHRGPLDLSRFDHTITPDDERSTTTVADLTSVTFIDAYGLVGLACYIATAAREGRYVRLRLPVSEEVRTYLARMHLQEVLDRYDVQVDGSLREVRGLDRRDGLIELRSFHDVHGSEQLAAFIWSRLEGNANPEVVTQLYEATGELGLNVVEHAGSPAGGFVAAQLYQRGQPGERAIIAVGDVGIGIRESLRELHGPMSDGAAIERAIQRDVSGKPDRGRGQGLTSVVEGVRDLGGTVRVRTGGASRSISRWAVDAVDTLLPLQGTIVGARLPWRPGRAPRAQGSEDSG
jgi:hypothetical protein